MTRTPNSAYDSGEVSLVFDCFRSQIVGFKKELSVVLLIPLEYELIVIEFGYGEKLLEKLRLVQFLDAANHF